MGKNQPGPKNPTPPLQRRRSRLTPPLPTTALTGSPYDTLPRVDMIRQPRSVGDSLDPKETHNTSLLL